MEADVVRRLKDAFPQFSTELIAEVYRFKGPKTTHYLAMLSRQTDENRPQSPSTPPSSHRDSTTFYACEASQSTPSRTSEALSEGSDEGGSSAVGKRDRGRHSSKDARLDVRRQKNAPQRHSDVNTLKTEKLSYDTQSSSSKGSDSSNSDRRIGGINLDLNNPNGSSSARARNALLDTLRSDGGDGVDSRLTHLNTQQLDERSAITKSDENGKESIERLLKLTSLERDFAMLQIEEGMDHRLEELPAAEEDSGEEPHQVEDEAVVHELVEAEDVTRQKLCHRKSNSCDAQFTLPFNAVEELGDSTCGENSNRAPHCDSDHGGVLSEGGIPRVALQDTQLSTDDLCTATPEESSGVDSEDPVDDPNDLQMTKLGDSGQEVEEELSSADGAETVSPDVVEEGERTGLTARQLEEEDDDDSDSDYLMFLENSVRAHRIRCALGLTDGASPHPSTGAQCQGPPAIAPPPGFGYDVSSEVDETNDPVPTTSALTPSDCTAQNGNAVNKSGTFGERHAEGMPFVEPVLTQHADVRALRWKSVQETSMDRLKECLAEFEASSPKDELKKVDRKVRMTVTQVAGSLRKVMDQTAELLKTINQQKTLSSKVFCCSRLAGHIVKRCCGLNEVLAIAQAHVARNLIAEYPDLLRLIMFHLHQTSPLLVPVFWTYDQSSPAARQMYEKNMKYIRATGGMTEQMQNIDQYLARHAGLVYFHAGLIAVASERDLYGVEAGWTYLARFLNEIPPDQTTVPFLFYFLKIAGHSLHSKYKCQFLKLLRFVERKFVEGESLKDDPSVLPAVSRLRTYISSEAYLQVPESLTMPETEASLLIHA